MLRREMFLGSRFGTKMQNESPLSAGTDAPGLAAEHKQDCVPKREKQGLSIHHTQFGCLNIEH